MLGRRQKVYKTRSGRAICRVAVGCGPRRSGSDESDRHGDPAGPPGRGGVRATDQTDGQLLASFIEQHDEAAFATLVRRHGPMVWAVCRHVVGHHHDAEDAFQATFLVLARKASSVRPREGIANWLHGVALRTARKAKGTAAKRRVREKQVSEMPEPAAVQQEQGCDHPLLAQELNGLSAKYRLPILLCDLEGRRSRRPLGNSAGRGDGGRATRPGPEVTGRTAGEARVVLPTGLLAVIASQNGVFAGVPVSLVSSTAKAATLILSGQETAGAIRPRLSY